LKKVKSLDFSSNEKEVAFPIDLDEEQQVLAAALAEVSMALNSSLDLDDVLDCILENLARVVTYKTANIMMIDGEKARIVRSRGYESVGTKEKIHSISFIVSEIPHLRQMADTKSPILSYYPHIEQDWNHLPESEWIKSHIASPIISGGEVIGFLNCDSEVALFFSKLQATAIQIFASQVGQAIRNARLFDTSKRLAEKFKFINELTREMLEAKKLDEIFEFLPDRIKEFSGAANVYISRWDENSKTVTGWAATGRSKKEYLDGRTQPGDQTITAEVLESRIAVVIEDIFQTEMIEKKYQGLYHEKTLYCLPLIHDSVKFGAIMIGYENPEKITEEVRSFGEYAAMQISAAIAKIRMLELEQMQSSQLAHANALIESLSRVSAAIKSGLDTEKVMSTIGSELELMNIHSIVALRMEETADLKITYSSIQENLFELLREARGSKSIEIIAPIDMMPIFRKTFDSQQAQYLERPEEVLTHILPEFYKPVLPRLNQVMRLSKETKGILVPLVVEQKTIGLMGLWAESLQKIDIQAANIFGGQVAIAIENAKLLQEVQRLAITDELTNVLNRRGFDEVSNREFGAAKRYDRPLSLIMLDIDRFKAINDVYGHPIGDEILVEIAARARLKVRDTDYIARYGGEEFLILLIEQKPENAKTVAERIRKSVAEQPFVTSVGKIMVTISVGVTGATMQMTSINMMIKTVDKALYKSKENGRNRVTLIDTI